tara:strand:- start:3213 stop:4214 length:1002 start_codon:yes stop_codon:yes gene_type:complete
MNWKSIIATALVTGLVTVLTGMTLFWWQTEKSELTYNSIQSIPFDEPSNSLFIQQVEIKNSGDKVIEDIVFVVSFSGEVIERSRIAIDNAISHTKELRDNSITLKIDGLNPSESANVSVLYRATSPQSGGASISLRGKGVVGKIIGYNEGDKKAPIFISLIAAYAGIFAFLMSTKRGRKALPLVFKMFVLGRSIGGEQRHEIASALSMYGYPEKAKEYLSSSASRRYWVEADLLAAEALKCEDAVKIDTIAVLKVISDIEAIHERSKAIAFYNIARLHKSMSSEDEAGTYLELAKSLDATEIENRLGKDPIFLRNHESNNKCHADAPDLAPVS